MRGLLTASVIVLLAIGLAAFLHGLDIAAEGPAAGGLLRPTVKEVTGWQYQAVDPKTGAVLYDVRGDRAVPDGPSNLKIDGPRVTRFGKQPITATAEFATASFPKKAEAIIRFQRDIRIVRGGWLMRGDEIVLTIPPDAEGRPDKDRGRLTSRKPVTLEIAGAHGFFTGTGLDADAEGQRNATLAPPVHGEIDAAALADVEGFQRSRLFQKGDRLIVDTDAPVKVTEVRDEEYEVEFLGPARPVLLRGKEKIAYPAFAKTGGKIRLRRPPEKAKETGALPLGSAPAAADFGGGVELRRGDRLLAAGERLRWDGANEVATLDGAPAKQAELHAIDERAEVHANTIRYIVARAEAELTGAVHGIFPYAPKKDAAADPLAAGLKGTWEVDAPKAVVHFDRAEDAMGSDEDEGDGGSVDSVVATAAPGDPVRVRHAEDDGRGEAALARYFPNAARLELEAAKDGGPARFARGRSALAARSIAFDRAVGVVTMAGDVVAELESGLWGGKAAVKGDADAPFDSPIRSAKETRSGRTEREDTGEFGRMADADWHVEADEVIVRFSATGGTLTAVDLFGRERQALLRSRPRGPADPVYEVRGARISADRLAGTVLVTPAPGGAPRQTLVRGRDRLEAREIRYDEARGVATATGEALYQREGAGAEPPLRAEAAEVELYLLAGAKGEKSVPSNVIARGAPGRPVVVVREDPKRPIRLTAPRIEGLFDRATGKLASARVEGDGGPVVIEPAYAAAENERFRLVGSRIVYDVASESGEVFGLNGPPEVLRGADERLTAKRALFDLKTQTIALREGVHGRFLGRLPAALAGGSSRAKGDRATLFDLDADEADVSLADGLASLDARGAVRFHDKQNDVHADKATYSRESATVTLEGRPIRILRGSRPEAAPRTLTVRLNPEDIDRRE